MACWLPQPTSNKELCDAIDEIMKPEREDILVDDPLSSTAPLDLDLESFSDLLDNSTNNVQVLSPMSPATSATTHNYTQPLNIYDISTTSNSTFPVNNNNPINSQSNTTTGYSSLGISPKFTTLSLNQQHNPFSPPLQDPTNSSILLQPFVQSSLAMNSKNNLHPPPFVQTQQQDNSSLGASYPFELQVNSGISDVKRFRSASMNEGATQHQQAKLDPHGFDPYRLRSHTYVTPPYYQNRASSLATTTTSSVSSIATDASSNSAWPYGDGPRPASSSFSEVLSQQQQLRLNNSLSASYGGSGPFYSLQPPQQQQRSSGGFLPDINFQTPPTTNCTLFSINQQGNGATSPSPSNPTRKRPSLVGFPVEEIKLDPDSPSCTLEQSEPDLWSDIEQNSSDRFQDNDGDEITSDDETTTISTSLNNDSTLTTQENSSQPNSSSLFWQYNVQAKGPKTKRILYLKERDPHLCREFSDPVYQIKLTQTKGQQFTKLRKGDGNDVTPNPMKLYQLGKQIRDLSMVGKSHLNTPSVYHGIYHVEQQSNPNDTAEVKKEKNKIASRACRLRKKAQHEANKLKLHGLNEEHRTLINLIASIKLLVLKRYHDGQLNTPCLSPNQSLETALDQLIATRYKQPVAGNADGFVQGILNDMEHMYSSKQQRSYSLNT
ncbi:unnamed protein product [Adineta ricciae]|uniref:BZIP domain-containing protein n=1 Tax=Adineta ricciae TaxID=249248 RepID=A0A815EXF7_ADIRI|nr:unnamed protein product [Adineta ricciae]